MVLDVMLPGTDGVQVCRSLREEGVEVPVILLTARGAIDERVAGLDAGADDYLVKPFAFEELLARIRVQLRRHQAQSTGETLRFGSLTLDLAAHEARVSNRRVDFTAKEFELLELFMRHPRQVLTRAQIFEHVWGYDFGATSNALGVYIGYLRRKTEALSLIHI